MDQIRKRPKNARWLSKVMDLPVTTLLCFGFFSPFFSPSFCFQMYMIMNMTWPLWPTVALSVSIFTLMPNTGASHANSFVRLSTALEYSSETCAVAERGIKDSINQSVGRYYSPLRGNLLNQVVPINYSSSPAAVDAPRYINSAGPERPS